MSHLESAKRTLQIEAEALQFALHNLDNTFNSVIDRILQQSGRLIVCGMGKSGHIGKKIAATLASTGTPSFFVHPAEAFHGDLGMLTEQDTFLSISNSGETDEVLKLIPSLKTIGCLHITLVGNTNSTLGKHADFALNIGVEKEACPLQLAPTSSTTTTLAMGDAIAVALMEAKQFKAEDFAKYHPGGSLGRKLLTKVSDVMRSENLPVCSKSTEGKELIQLMTSGKLGVVIVKDENTVLGLVTDGDLRRAIEKFEANFFTTEVEKFMTTSPKMIAENSKAIAAEELMRSNNISTLLVHSEENEKEVVGVVQIYSIA